MQLPQALTLYCGSAELKAGGGAGVPSAAAGAAAAAASAASAALAIQFSDSRACSMAAMSHRAQSSRQGKADTTASGPLLTLQSAPAGKQQANKDIV